MTAIVVACGTSSRRNPSRFAAHTAGGALTKIMASRVALARQPGQAINYLSLSPAEFDDSITTVEVAQFIQAAPERPSRAGSADALPSSPNRHCGLLGSGRNERAHGRRVAGASRCHRNAAIAHEHYPVVPRSGLASKKGGT
jgi:hypothetical protein